MLESFVKFGFSAGVLDQKLHGRGDLKNYDLGLAEGHNWCVDYLGGVFTRPGTEFRDYTADPLANARLIPFQFNNDIANTYLIIITGSVIRFMQDGDYVLQPSKTITTLGPTLTVNAHGYANGQWVKILGETYIVRNATTNTFTLENFFDQPVDLTDSGATSVARIYSLTSPYAAADLPLLKYDQDGDSIYLNHPNYAERKLTRIANDNWTIAATAFNPTFGLNPVNIFFTPTLSAAGSSAMLYAVCSVDAQGRERPLASGACFIVQNCVDFTATAGSVTLRWGRANNAVSYNIYRSLVVPDGRANFGMDLGYVGSSSGTVFTDNNIVPDFTRAPLKSDNPFANGAVIGIDVTGGGSGYPVTATAVLGGVLNGDVMPIVEGGVVRGVRILNPGSSTNPVSISFFSGTGAVADVIVSSSSGNNPSTSAKVQQRRVRGGTLNAPLGIFGSRVGSPDSYDVSGFDRADDPYILSLDAATQTPIRHIVPSTEGFFALCDDLVFLVRGIDDAALTATTAKASPQTSDGASHVKPLRIDREIVYLTSEFNSIVAIAPSNLPTYFTAVERGVLSSHYFTLDNPIQSMAWAKSPNRLIWASRKDGTFLSCAYLTSQEVFAWTDHSTAGRVTDLTVVRENGQDRVYALVQRFVQGRLLRFVERFAPAEPETEEDMWAVDCGLRSSLGRFSALPTPITLTITQFSGEITITSNIGIFGVGDVGKVFRAKGGRGEVIQHLSATQLKVRLDIPLNRTLPDLPFLRLEEGEWSLTQPFTTFSGLNHLEGLEVEVLADGAAVGKKTVTNGAITLDEPASLVTVGLGFTGKLKTLPPSVSGTVLENREKAVRGLAVRLYKARGLRFGDGTGDITYPLPPRTTEPFGVAPRFKQGLHSISIRSGYDLDGAITIVKEGPQSAFVLGLVTETEIEG